MVGSGAHRPLPGHRQRFRGRRFGQRLFSGSFFDREPFAPRGQRFFAWRRFLRRFFPEGGFSLKVLTGASGDSEPVEPVGLKGVARHVERLRMAGTLDGRGMNRNIDQRVPHRTDDAPATQEHAKRKAVHSRLNRADHRGCGGEGAAPPQPLGHIRRAPRAFDALQHLEAERGARAAVAQRGRIGVADLNLGRAGGRLRDHRLRVAGAGAQDDRATGAPRRGREAHGRARDDRLRVAGRDARVTDGYVCVGEQVVGAPHRRRGRHPPVCPGERAQSARYERHRAARRSGRASSRPACTPSMAAKRSNLGIPPRCRLRYSIDCSSVEINGRRLGRLTRPSDLCLMPPRLAPAARQPIVRIATQSFASCRH